MSSVCIRIAAAALMAAAASGCGLGPGDATEGEATLTVTRDYGADVLIETEIESPAESDTVMRALDREAEIETRYGGGFVQSIEGVEGDFRQGRSYDWFFFVNGVESEIGAAEVALRGGDRIWWDHRDWTEAMRVPAVVGSWPEPFRQKGTVEDREPVAIECGSVPQACELTQEALAGAGVNSAVEPLGAELPADAFRILVAPARELADDPAAAQVSRGPERSGVYARVEEDAITLLDERGQDAGTADGLVAATRAGDEPPVWIVTGPDAAGTAAAAELLDPETLSDHYAVAMKAGSAIPVPAVSR